MTDRIKDILGSINQTLKTKSEDDDFLEKENTEEESPEIEMMEYKKDFYDMSVGSLRAVMQHSTSILNSLDNPTVRENLTAAHLQGMISVVEDQMRSIHDFVMYVSESDDTEGKESKPGLWDNIRKKKEKMGKKYKPAKPGDKDRPDPKQWKKLTK
jgi:hypothetical protein